MTLEELELVAKSGAVVCLCPSTEANLGDGLFRLQPYLQNDGQIAVGSDSHVTVNPFEELRWLEYGQRLAAQERNVAAVRTRNTGRSLYELAAAGGAAAAGDPEGGHLKVGARADLIVLDDHSPMLVGHGANSLLDALVFSGFTLPIDRVMVSGDWKVMNGIHTDAESARKKYAETIGQLNWNEMAAS
jgi:formimidoylglutamate deiminase